MLVPGDKKEVCKRQYVMRQPVTKRSLKKSGGCRDTVVYFLVKPLVIHLPTVLFLTFGSQVIDKELHYVLQTVVGSHA